VSIALGIPWLLVVGCWTREMAVPWNDVCELVKLVLWSVLSTADVVNNPFLNWDGHTTPSRSYLQLSTTVTNDYNKIG
jgi:ABC-type branched-subunit amino acid transport system substrate-binding protein